MQTGIIITMEKLLFKLLVQLFFAINSKQTTVILIVPKL